MKSILLVLFFGITISQQSVCQLKGDFFICYGFEFPSGGYLSLRYYPMDKIGMEVYSSTFWNIFNYGVRANIHAATELPHTYISIGFTNISAYNPDAVYDTSSTQPMFLRRIIQGIDLGIGREVELDFKHFSFQLGPTYILKMEDTFLNPARKEETFSNTPLFSYYLVGIQLAQLPEKNPQPIRVK